MRSLAAGFIAAAIIGLIPVEITALVLSAVALPVAVIALVMAFEMRRTFREEIERQTDSTRALEMAAGEIRADDA